MTFPESALPFKKWCKNRDFSRLIREDSEIELKVKDEKFNSSQSKMGDFVESPIFPDDPDAHFKWKLKFYPLGDDESNSGYSSVFIWLTWKKVKIPVLTFIRFEVKTGVNSVLATEKFEHTFLKEIGRGYGKFCQINKLKVNLNGNLAVCAQVCAYYEAYSCYTNNFTSERKLLNNFSSLLEDDTFSDVIICGNETKFKVHRAILASRSKVFAAMLSNKMKENATGEIVINDIPDITIKSMLKFIYSCEIDFENVTMALDLLQASEKYDLSDLKLQCGEYLSSIIDESNSARILLSANFCNLVDLKTDVLNYICKNKDKFSDGNQYKILSKGNPDLLIEVINELSKYVDVDKIKLK